MIENRFVSIRLIAGRPRKVIVDECGDIVNKSPSKEELKGLKEETFKKQKYTKKQLLGFIIKFYTENGRVPEEEDFINDDKFPGHYMYFKVFGSWNNAIRRAGLWDKRRNKENTCDRCGGNFEEIERLGGHPRKECDEKGNWTGKWNCPACYQKFDPNSQNKLVKSMRYSRMGNLDPDRGRKNEERI